MPVDYNLDISMTPAQKSAIEAVLTNAMNQIQAIIVDPLNLSDKERQTTPSVDVRRESFVTDAINNLSGQFPNLVSTGITTARVRNLWQFRNASLSLMTLIDEIRDRLGDAAITAETICLQFTRDMRRNALYYKSRNVHGADVIWDRLKDLEPNGFKLSKKESKPV
jgi:hypothetical protein